jgi:hypothetical protein
VILKLEEREQLLKGLQLTDPILFENLPQAEKYENYFEYEKALLDWKVAVETALKNLQLPNLMGRNYYRPRVAVVKTNN